MIQCMDELSLVKNTFNATYCSIEVIYFYLSEVESRTQGSRPRPRTQKKSEAKAKDSLSEDRHSRGQGQECSRPRTQAQVLSKKKKRSSQKFFKRSPQKNVFQKIFQALHKILTIQKILLSSSRGQANFRGLEASRPRPRTMCPRGRPRGQGRLRGLHLCYLYHSHVESFLIPK